MSDPYDYSHVIFKNPYSKVKILCLRCNKIFHQTPYVHLIQGSGCPKCNKTRAQSYFALTLKQVIQKINDARIFEYVSGEYVNQKSRLTLRCLKNNHEVSMVGYNIVSAKGCGKCIGFHKTTKDIISEYQKVHGNHLYCYQNVVYKGAKEKVKIKCLRCHREFEQLSFNHLKGKGCPSCNPGNVSKLENLWLDSLDVPADCRQITIMIRNRIYKVDALVGKTVYEFNGDYFHGNPRVYARDFMNDKNGKSMGELYDNTIDKQKALQDNGYEVISMWESDFKC